MTKKLLMLMAILLLLGVGTAFAFPLYQGTATNPGTKFEDNNLDYFLDLDDDGLISVGDVLYSALEFDYIIDQTGGSPNYFLDDSQDELVAWATIQVASMNGNVWTFQQYGDIPMAQVYSGLGTSNLDTLTVGNDPNVTDAEAAVKNGAVHLWDFSITDDPDTYWAFTALLSGADDPSVVKGLPSAINVGVANFQLNQVWGDDIFEPIFGLTLSGGDGLVDLIGSATIQGGAGLTEGDEYAFARSDTDALVNPSAPIPEPSTLILLGAGLLGLFGIMRKRPRN